MNGGVTASGGSPSTVEGYEEEEEDELQHLQHHHKLALVGTDGKLLCIQDDKAHSLFVLKHELMTKLNDEVKSLDQDSWMFDGPRSRINLISGPGGLRHGRTEILTRRDLPREK